jgi:molybdenum cofactor cytidylyltransferase
MNGDIGILILAAGEARRMGTPKQLLPWGEHTLLGHVISVALNTNIGPVFCVLGAHADQIRSTLSPSPADVWVNPDWDKGLASSLAFGVQQAQRKRPALTALLVILGDQPLVQPQHLQKLVELHQVYPDKIVASAYTQGAGVPTIFPRDFFSDLEQLQGDMGARKLLRSYQEKVITIAAPGKLIDIDTPEDYQALMGRVFPCD